MVAAGAKMTVVVVAAWVGSPARARAGQKEDRISYMGDGRTEETIRAERRVRVTSKRGVAEMRHGGDVRHASGTVGA